MQERAIFGLACGRVETEPDGSVCWLPDPRSRREGSLAPLVLGLALWGTGGLGIAGVLLANKEVVLMTVAAEVSLPAGSLLVWQAFRSRFGGEVWRARLDHLELRQTLFGWQRSTHYRGAAMELVYSPADSWVGGVRGLPTYRESQLTEAEAIRDPTTWCGLFVVADGRRRCLMSSSQAPLRVGDLRGLGELLSERTGWALQLRRG